MTYPAHTTTPRPPLTGSRRRSVRDVVRGVAAFGALTAAVVGPPPLLLVIAPLRLHLPTWGQTVAVLTRPDDGTVLLAALTVTAWVCWAVLTVTILAEVAAQIRGLPAVRLPGLDGVQHVVSVLVAAVSVVLVPAASAADAAHAATVTVTAPVAPGRPRAEDPPTGASPTATARTEPTRPARSTADAPLPQVTIRSGDSLWGLAERHLGAGDRYDEIARLNYGRVQPGGGALTDEHWLRPGWVLRLPVGATNLPGQSDTYTVRRGDTLSEIAAYQLDDPDRYEEVFDLNVGRRQPDGHRLTDPDLIRPGWILHLPEPPGAPTPPGAPPLTPSDAAGPTAPPTSPHPPDPVGSPAPSATPAAGSPSPALASTVTSSPTDDAEKSAPGPEKEAEDYRPIAALLSGLGGLAAAGIIREVSRRRRRAQARRRPGERLPAISAVAERADRALRAHQQPVTLDLLRRSLHQLTASCRDLALPLPRIGAVLLSPDHLELRLTEPHPAHPDTPAPFRAVEARRWRLDPALLSGAQTEADPGTNHEPDPELDPADGEVGVDDDTADPCPALVTVGTAGDALVMVNLEAAGTFTVTGDTRWRSDVIRALAVELVTSPLTENAEITLDPDLADLAQVVEIVRARAARDPAATARHAGVHHRDTTTAWTRHDVGDILDARVRGLVPDTWAPRIDIATTPGEPQPAGADPWTGHVLITAADNAVDATAGWVLTLTAGGGRLEPLGLDIVAQHLDPEHYQAVLDLLGPVDPTPVPPVAAPPDAASEGPLELQTAAAATTPPTAAAPASNGTRHHTTNRPSPFDSHTSAVLEAQPIYDALRADPPLRLIETTAQDHRDTGTTAKPTPSTAVPPAGVTPNGAPRLLLLGPIEVIGANEGAVPSRRRRMVELTAFLALHPAATAHALDEALWPGARVGVKTRNSAVSRVRLWLGKAPDGEPYLMNVGDTGVYRLHPDVTTDWHDLLTLARRGLQAGPDGIDDLAAALALVRGRPFTGIDPRDYAWAEPDIQEMISTIVDVAAALADQLHAAGDHVAAQEAAARGLAASTCHEPLWQACLRAARARGDTAEEHRLRARYRASCADTDNA